VAVRLTISVLKFVKKNTLTFILNTKYNLQIHKHTKYGVINSGKEFLFRPHTLDRFWESNQPPTQWLQGGNRFLGGKALPERDADHSSPSGVEWCVIPFITLIMEGVRTSETSVYVDENTALYSRRLSFSCTNYSILTISNFCILYLWV
jgi:hypothetical protein